MVSDLLLQVNTGEQIAALLGSTTALICAGIVAIVQIIAWWRLFDKANRPGWLAVIPLVNVLIYIDISGKPMWWIILLLIPLVNIVVLFLIHQSIAERFGEGTPIALGLLLLTPLFVLLLGFGDYEYQVG